MSEGGEGRRLTIFGVILTGQVVSLFGSALSGFAVGVWVYQKTGSVTQFGLISLFVVLPGTLLSPLAGALVDRWDRRWTLILSDAVAALGTVVILAMVSLDRLAVWHVYVASLLSSTAGAFQFPASGAVTTVLVPKRHLARASGIQQTAAGIGTILAPLLGGVLLATVGLRVILVADLVSFVFAVVALLAVRIPRPAESAVGAAARGGSILRQAQFGWLYIRQRPGLLALLLVFAVLNFGTGVVQVLITPLVLSFGSVEVLGKVLTVGSAGSLVGGALISAWGGPRRKVHGIFASLLVAGLVLLLGGLEPNAPLVSGAVFVYLLAFPVTVACSQAIWQVKVEPDIQGRVFAMRRMIAVSAMPVAFAVTGPLADHVFEPLMAPGGALAGTVGRVLGVGAGRGVGLMIMLMGLLILATVVVAWRNRRLRDLETEIPDAVD